VNLVEFLEAAREEFRVNPYGDGYLEACSRAWRAHRETGVLFSEAVGLIRGVRRDHGRGTRATTLADFDAAIEAAREQERSK
jgi:hypothetical protein